MILIAPFLGLLIVVAGIVYQWRREQVLLLEIARMQIARKPPPM